ncbi:MAG: nitrite reductase [Desulfovibrionaceae bacterium]|nr:nitrite reductase [Desulfovibrionaceae bacterium]
MELKEFIEQLPKRAVRAKKDGTYTVTPGMRQGVLPAGQLAAIAGVVEEYGLKGVRISTGQRLVVDGVPGEVLPEVVEKIGPVGDVFRNKVQACQGVSGCNLGQRDSMGAAAALEEFLKDRKFGIKLKAGASGCPMCCAESMIRDVGLIGRKNGWTVSFGGNGGRRARKGDILAVDVSREEAFAVIGKALDYYAANARNKERTARFVERVGIDAVKAAIR